MDHMNIGEIHIPSFRIKRSHKKSRTGCTVCKRRRVKCDETRPGCDICRRRGLECVYAEQTSQTPRLKSSHSQGDDCQTSNELPAAGISRSSSVGSSPVSLPPPAPLDALAPLETELFNHYFSHTVGTMPAPSRPAFTVWETSIPALAHNSTPVRHGMLTLAALCLHHHSTPEQPLYWLDIAEYYGEQFVRQSSQQMQDLTPENMDSNFACSRLLVTLALGFFRVHQHYNGVVITDRSAWTWLHMTRGVWNVYLHYTNTGVAGDSVLVSELIPESWSDPELSYAQDSPEPYTQHAQYATIQSSRHARFAALHRALSERRCRLGEELTAEYASAITNLVEITNRVCTGHTKGLTRFISLWPCRLSKVFVDNLVGGETFALAIHAHWLMLMMLSENLWHIGDMARSGIREIVAICDADVAASAERDVIEWPKRLLQEAWTFSELDSVMMKCDEKRNIVL